ncbi:hypothetical protein RDV64_01540 [Acuticoccus sp. MNP-M23]|uniref:hypothetical protein n=1 Tax=Acuticoccus sp. MNP-M23 TaxID=3072793 RepID=UPI002815F83B|nr:hypothetical protein [Acuticoccus sp. MNP-M23]WMS43115.1 hypothetical protein RDV64_01540 [Acuticoccus sp. MNP-M23]
MKHYVVLADWEIRDFEIYVERIWRPAKAKGIARVPWLDALTLVFLYEAQVFWPSGRVLELPHIHHIFPDPENRWMSDFLAADESGLLPRTHCRIIPRLRLIALYCDIAADAHAVRRSLPAASQQAPGGRRLLP